LLKGSPCCLHEGVQACLSDLKGLLKDTAKQNTIAAPSHCRKLSGSGIMQECILVDAGKLKVLPAVNMTPVMAVRVRTVQMSAVLRVSLSPVLDDLPFIGGVALSFMTQPYLDFDLRYLAQQLPHHCRVLGNLHTAIFPMGSDQSDHHKILECFGSHEAYLAIEGGPTCSVYPADKLGGFCV